MIKVCLKELNYDVIKYDAGDIRNTSVIEDITRHNMSDKNIMSMFYKKIKKINFHQTILFFQEYFFLKIRTLFPC